MMIILEVALNMLWISWYLWPKRTINWHHICCWAWHRHRGLGLSGTLSRDLLRHGRGPEVKRANFLLSCTVLDYVLGRYMRLAHTRSGTCKFANILFIVKWCHLLHSISWISSFPLVLDTLWASTMRRNHLSLRLLRLLNHHRSNITLTRLNWVIVIDSSRLWWHQYRLLLVTAWATLIMSILIFLYSGAKVVCIAPNFTRLVLL